MITYTKTGLLVPTDRPLYKDRALYSRWYKANNPQKCKMWADKSAKKWRLENPVLAREIDRAKHIKYKDKRKLYNSEYHKNYKTDPVKRRARRLLNSALETGRMKKPKLCSKCKTKGIIHGHHDDYSKPLVVRWLCSKCHGLEHHPILCREETIKNIEKLKL